MANFTPVVRKYHRSLSFKTIWADFRRKRDPDDFKISGSQIYSGMQGQGKTLGMVYHGLHRIKRAYPKSWVVTNLHLRHLKPISFLQWQSDKYDANTHYVHFDSHVELMQVLRGVRNGEHGVIFMIDEIHNYFHSHDSKSMPMWVVQVFSQQRKQKIVILGTVQDWEDVIKAIRRQIDNLILCSKSFGYFMRQVVIDPRSAENNYGNVEFEVKKRGFFWMSKEVQDSYDTFQVINSGREIMGGEDLNIGVHQVPEKSGAKRPIWRRR